MVHLHKLLILVYSLGSCITITAQNTIPASGGNASGSGGTASYSIGQIVYIKSSGMNGTATQGVQQPYEISALTGIEEAKDALLEFVVYPNPTTDFIKLSVKNFELNNLKFQLYDTKGGVLQVGNIISDETDISMQNRLPSTYFLKVIQGKKEIITFKIIKH